MRPAEDANFPYPNGVANEAAIESEVKDNFTKFDYVSEEVAAGINMYYTPIIIVFGCFGNIISLFVFYTNKSRMQSTSVYLSALALSDTLFLIQLMPPWLDSVHYSKMFYQPGFCQLTVYLSYVTCCLSTWIVVAFTVERFVAVQYPLQRSLCTVNRAKYIVGLLSFLTLILNIPVLRFASPSKEACSIDENYLNQAANFNIVDTIIAFTVPLGAIIILNTRIIIGVCRLERARQQLLKVEQPRPNTITPPSVMRSQHRVTRMLLIVSSVFVVLNLPAYTMRILAYTYNMNSNGLDGVRWAAFQQLALTFFHTNYAINFVLYCLSGQNFRRALCHAIPCLRRYDIQATIDRPNTFHTARASSISTSYMSGLESGNTAAEGVRPHVRRHRFDPVIKRWTFDNSRHRSDHEDTTIEMETCNVGSETEHRILHVPRRIPSIDDEIRPFPYLLFPFKKIIIAPTPNK